jgi:5-methylcytosine-specific restriction endonuclease McrA
MKKHIKVYTSYFGIGEQDTPTCEVCGVIATDIHHILYKSQGGKDIIENLIGLCRECHNKAHANEIKPDELTKIHNKKL